MGVLRLFFPVPLLLLLPAAASASEGGSASPAAYFLWPPFLLFALWWLARGGRWSYPWSAFLIAMGVAVAAFGFGTGGVPNPVAGVLDLFRGGEGPGIAAAGGTLLFFAFFSILGTKLLCGWGCPFGALQELLYALPGVQRSRHRQIPFFMTLPVRTVATILFVLSAAGLLWGVPLYDAVDPFRLFALDFSAPVLVFSGIILIASTLVYRPFCQLLCPFGWFSWLLERFSLFAVRIDRGKCVRCNACARACPTEAARGRLLGSPLPPDCFSCARCLRVCRAGAIRYGRRTEG